MTYILNTKWTLYLHYPNDNNWDENSYKKIDTIETLEGGIILLNKISPNLYKKCMFFLMRENIKPMWEDEENKYGGAFSYKIPEQNLKDIWKGLSYQAIGETLLNDEHESILVNGITLSPKKNFGIIKIWLKNCTVDDPNAVNYFENISKEDCIFKKHIS